jgi:dTDP-glucose 4,6-dehydratase
MNILVTGGCGFIGSHFIEEFINLSNVMVNVDNLAYSANRNLPFELDNRYHHYKLDISKDSILFLLKKYDINYIIHFAAESHVDNSIKDSSPFIQTNIVGTHKILNDLLRYEKDFRFVHVSTDEVYGSLGVDGFFNSRSPYRPNSPYAASKASSDLLVRSFVQTYKLPAIITNTSNNFGPRQFREKMIPLCVDYLKNKRTIPLYGDGLNIRDWIYVKDHVRALWNVLCSGRVGGQYLIGGNHEMNNFELINYLKNTYESVTGFNIDWNWFEYVSDRKGHDFRYAIDTSEYNLEFPLELTDFDKAIRVTVESLIT